MTIPDILSTRYYHAKKQTNMEQPRQAKTGITLPYMHTASEMTSRLLRPFNIDVAHKPTNKLRSNFTKHKDKTLTTNKHNAIYMFSCTNCLEKYIGQTSKKIQTRLTEHQNAINRHDHNSLPAKHADDNGHKFDWSQTKCLGQATTKHAREFKKAWHSLDKQTFNRHIDIPLIYLQLKRSCRSLISSPFLTPIQPTTLPTTIENDDSNMHSTATNDHQAENRQPIRRSRRLQHHASERARRFKTFIF